MKGRFLSWVDLRCVAPEHECFVRSLGATWNQNWKCWRIDGGNVANAKGRIPAVWRRWFAKLAEKGIVVKENWAQRIEGEVPTWPPSAS